MIVFLRYLLSSHAAHLEDLRTANERERAALDKAYAVAVDAKMAEVQAVVAAKDSVVSSLQLQVKILEGQLEHERARAEAAVDRLLARDAKVPPVGNADISREFAARDARAVMRGTGAEDEDRKAEQLRSIFREVNAAGEDEGEEDPARVVENVGGLDG